jgi:carboxyl-terminal processing protease
VGTRSFGKGLVQNEFILNDGSRLRLTISKYYTPSGRLIQKPYENKNLVDYYSHDEPESDSLIYADSLVADSFLTVSGRKVYSGGGITPDTVIEYNSNSIAPRLTQKMYEKRIFYEVASNFAVENKDLKERREWFLNSFKMDDKWFKKLIQAAEENEIIVDREIWLEDRIFIENRLKAEIARNFWSQNEFWRVILQNDNQFENALNLFPDALKIQNYLMEKTSQN